jgi:hypothetical protein
MSGETKIKGMGDSFLTREELRFVGGHLWHSDYLSYAR